MPQVNIPDIGLVNFPDSMSQEDITASIKTKIIPQYQAKQQATGKNLMSVIQNGAPRYSDWAAPEDISANRMGMLGTLSDIQAGLQHQAPPQAQSVAEGARNFGVNTISSLTDPKTAAIGLGLGGLGLIPKVGIPLARLALLGLGTKVASEGLGQAAAHVSPGETTEGLLNAGTGGLMALGGVLPTPKEPVAPHLQAQPPKPLTVAEINERAGLQPRQNQAAIPMGSGQDLAKTPEPFDKGKVLPTKPAKMDVPAVKAEIAKIPTAELGQRYNDIQAGAKVLMQQGNLPEANNLIVRGQFLREELQRRQSSESSPKTDAAVPTPPVKAVEVTPPALAFKPAVRVEGKVTEGAHGAAAQKAYNEAQTAGVPKPKVERGFVDNLGNWYATPLEVARKKMESKQAPQPKVTNEKENETTGQAVGVLGREGQIPQTQSGNVRSGERGSEQSGARGKNEALTKEEKAVEQERLQRVLNDEAGFIDVKAIADSVGDFAKEKIAPAWDEFKNIWNRHQLRASGEALPFHAQQDKELGNKAYLVGQAPAIANRLAEVDPKIVLNGAKPDSEFDQILGSVWTEAQLRDKRSALQEQGRDEEARKVETVVGNGRSPIKDEAHYQALLRNPMVQEASMDFKRLIGNKAQERQENLKGNLARQPGMGFVNLLVKDEPKQTATSGLRSAQLKGSALNRTRTGTGTSYDTSATRMMQNAIKANYYRSALADYYKEAERTGVGMWVKAGEKVPEGYVAVPQDVTKLIIKEGDDVTVKTIRKDFYLKKQVMPEFRRITNLDRDALIQNDHKVAEFFTKLQVEMGIDALGHSGNIVAAVNSAAKNSLGKNIIGGREASTIADITKIVGQELASKPEFLHVAHTMAERGILREAHTMEGWLGPLSPGGAIIKHLDSAGRQILYRAAVDMANKGLGKADIIDIRRQIDKQLGQYNPRLMTAWQHIMRSVFSPFSVASRTFNSLATQRLLLSPGFQAANKAAWAKLAARQLAYAATAYFVAPMVVNYEQTGEFFPEGVKFGEGVIGKNKDGTYQTFDFLKLNFLRRAMRVTGVGKVMEGQVLPRLRGELVQALDATGRAAAMDVIGGKIAPYTAGPIPQAATALILGKSPAGYDLRQKGENQPPYFMAAARTLNPVSGALMQGASQGDTAAPLVKRLEQTVGVGTSSKPEQIINGLRRQFLYKLGKAKQADYPPSDYDTLRTLLAKADMDGAKKEYARLLEQKTEEHQFGKDPEGEAKKQLQTYFTTYAKGHGNVSKEDEAAFVKTLSPHQLDLYNETMKQKQAVADAFFALQPKQSKKGNFGFGSLKF